MSFDEFRQRFGDFLHGAAYGGYELDQVEGHSDKLVGLIQERYGYDRDRAVAEVNRFFEKYDTPA